MTTFESLMFSSCWFQYQSKVGNFPKLETKSWRDWLGLRSYSTSTERTDQIRAMTQHRERPRRSALELSVIRKRGRGQTVSNTGGGGRRDPRKSLLSAPGSHGRPFKNTSSLYGYRARDLFEPCSRQTQNKCHGMAC